MIIIYSNRILNALSWTMRVGGIALYPFIILRPQYIGTLVGRFKLNHEKIHIEQQKELLVIPFYVIYLLNYAFNIVTMKKNPYREIIFEKEAYRNQMNLDYLKTRKRYNYFRNGL